MYVQISERFLKVVFAGGFYCQCMQLQIMAINSKTNSTAGGTTSSMAALLEITSKQQNSNVTIMMGGLNASFLAIGFLCTEKHCNTLL